MKPIDLIELVPAELDTNSSGIYMIFCVPANKAYIGRSKNIKRRFYYHNQLLRKHKHTNPYLQNLYNKYGPSTLVFKVLESCSIDLPEREAYFLNQLDSESRLNLAAISDFYQMAEETKQKISKANKGCAPWNKGKPMSEETKQKLKGRKVSGNRKTGWKLTEVQIVNISNFQKGKITSDETKRKMSKTARENIEKRQSTKLTKEKVKEIRTKLLYGNSCKDIAQEYSISINTVYDIKNLRTWKPEDNG